MKDTLHGLREKANRITAAYRTKPGRTDPELSKREKEAVERWQAEDKNNIRWFDGLPSAMKALAELPPERARRSCIFSPETESHREGVCIIYSPGQQYAHAIFAGFQMILPDGMSREEIQAILKGLTDTTDTIEEV